MATSKVVLLETLENLGAGEFKKFKWYLQQSEVLEGFPSIPKSLLENTDREDTVDHMVQTYSINTIKVTKIVLGKIHKNDLVKDLSKNTLEPIGKS